MKKKSAVSAALLCAGLMRCAAALADTTEPQLLPEPDQVMQMGSGLGGAALSLMEGALLIFLIVFLAPRLGVTWFADHAAGTHLLAWFLNNTPRSIIASLT